LEEQYLTTEEAAQLLRSTPQAVTKWCRQGKIKAIRAGRKWLMTRAAVLEFATKGVPQEQNPKANDLVFAH